MVVRLYYFEPELTDDYDMGAWSPVTRRPSIALDAFLGLRHVVPDPTAIGQLPIADGETAYYTLGGTKIAQPQRGLNIVRERRGNSVRTYKVMK